MNKIQARRLLKLAKFLRERVPAHKFNFRALAAVGSVPLEQALETQESCGTVACAFGWAPACFPRQLKWTDGKYPGVVSVNKSNLFNVAERFFTANSMEWNKIFMPSESWGCSGLPDDASPSEVASHIEKVVCKSVGDDWYNRTVSKI